MLRAMKMLGNSQRGFPPSQKRLMYLTVVLPVLTYGYLLWYKPKGKGCHRHLKKLETVQSVAVRWITGAFKTTPTGGTEIYAGLAPLRCNMAKLYAKAAVRVHMLHPLTGLLNLGLSLLNWSNPSI